MDSRGTLSRLSSRFFTSRASGQAYDIVSTILPPAAADGSTGRWRREMKTTHTILGSWRETIKSY